MLHGHEHYRISWQTNKRNSVFPSNMLCFVYANVCTVLTISSTVNISRVLMLKSPDLFIHQFTMPSLTSYDIYNVTLCVIINAFTHRRGAAVFAEYNWRVRHYQRILRETSLHHGLSYPRVTVQHSLLNLFQQNGIYKPTELESILEICALIYYTTLHIAFFAFYLACVTRGMIGGNIDSLQYSVSVTFVKGFVRYIQKP